MWFSRDIFSICSELKSWGIEPRFEAGETVARGFADLGFEEFQVLPGEKLLSLTAGTISPLQREHAGHFFLLPTVDDAIDILDKLGAAFRACERIDDRDWNVSWELGGMIFSYSSRSHHFATLSVLLECARAAFKLGADRKAGGIS